MEDKANEGTEPEETTEPAAESADGAEKRPNRLLVGLGWTVGRGARAVAGGAKWVGRGLQGLTPARGEPLPDEEQGEGPVEGEDGAEQEIAEGEEQVEESTRKSRKKSKSE